MRLRRGRPTGADRESGYHSVRAASPADGGFERTGTPGLIEGRRAVARPPIARVGSIGATVLARYDSYEVGVGEGDVAVDAGAGAARPTITVATIPSSP